MCPGSHALLCHTRPANWPDLQSPCSFSAHVLCIKVPFNVTVTALPACTSLALSPPAAGYETSANALAFAIYCLATHPATEKALLAEVDALGGKVRQPLTPSSQGRLHGEGGPAHAA